MIKDFFKKYSFLHIILLVFSFGAVCSKKASGASFLSGEFILYYSIMILIMMIYAICWQQCIKHMSLTTAYANRSITVVWGMILGAIIFNEKISLLKVIGVIFIIMGVLLYFKSNDVESKNFNG